MLDDRNNKAYYNSFVNGHPKWRRWRQLQTMLFSLHGVHALRKTDKTVHELLLRCDPHIQAIHTGKRSYL